jgi:hypothetical protein
VRASHENRAPLRSLSPLLGGPGASRPRGTNAAGLGWTEQVKRASLLLTERSGATEMLDDNPQLVSLLDYVKADGRVCPMPIRWQELWEMLPGRERRGMAWEPPAPLILGEWWSTPSFAKVERLAEQIRYAHTHGVLAEVDGFLRGLPEAEWAHLGEFLSPPGA